MKQDYAIHNSLPLKLVNSLRLSSEIIDSPKGWYISSSDWITNSQMNKREFKGSYISIHPAHTIYREIEPKCINKSIPSIFLRKNKYKSPETFVVTIPAGRAWSDCAVITPDDKLLADASKIFHEPVENHPIFQKWKLRYSLHVDSRVAVLASRGGDHNYFHWLFDVLPRISLLASSGISIEDIDYFFVNELRYSFQKQTLAALGVLQEKTIECTNRTHIKADRLVVPSLPGDSGDIPSWACIFLRDSFLKMKSYKKNTVKRIYVNRLDANHRRILNEAEVIDFLLKYGFQSVSLTSMSFAKQEVKLT